MSEQFRAELETAKARGAPACLSWLTVLDYACRSRSERHGGKFELCPNLPVDNDVTGRMDGGAGVVSEVATPDVR